MAATVAFIDGDYNKEKAYLERFPLHPIAPGVTTDIGFVEYSSMVRVDKCIVMPSMNLMDLCDKIVKEAWVPGGGVMIVCHGNDQGLHIPAVAGGVKKNIGTDGMATLKRLLVEPRVTGKNDLGLDNDQLALLQQKLLAVHRKCLGHLAIRACRAAEKGPTVLENLITLFGAWSGSAPKQRVFAGDVRTNKATKNYVNDQWSQKVLPFQWMVYNEEPDRVAFQGTGGEIGNPHYTITHFDYESYAAVDNFVDRYLPGARTYKVSKKKIGKQTQNVSVEVEYDFKPGQTVPLYWMWDGRRMMFPMEQRFSDNLVYKTSANSAKVDLLDKAKAYAKVARPLNT